MNADQVNTAVPVAERSPFWVFFIVFALLAGDYGFRLVNLLQNRAQLERVKATQDQNAGVLTRTRQLDSRIEALSIELLQLGTTNAAAQRIVQELNIKWTPSSAPAGAAQPLSPGPVRPKK
jgi:hypothetical protein